MATPLTNLQLELLKVFTYQLPEEELLEVKRLLADFFAKRLTDRASEIWAKKGYSQSDMEKWLSDENQ
jgi:hypothetical protein